MFEQQILEEALTLSPLRRATLIEKLLISLGKPDASIDELWANEAENRVRAYDEGRIKSVSSETVLNKYKK